MENHQIEVSSDNWNVQRLRFTLFPHKAYDLDVEWWKKSLGSDPDNIQYDRRINKHHYDGEFEVGLMNMDFSPMRIDINYVPSNANPIIQMCDLNLGLFDKVLPVFISVVRKFLESGNCPPAQRIAFGSTLFIATNSRIKGYELLSKYLPQVNIDPENSSDFLYQINRRRHSSIVDGLLVNRLSKWHVVKYQTTASNNSQFDQNAFKLFDDEFSVNVDLDINSVQDYEMFFLPETQSQLFEEFVEFSKEIAQNGDIT